MLLVIDVGNTNTVLGVFERVAHRPGEDVTTETARYERLVANWRVGSHLTRTVDEYGVIFRNLFAMDNLEVSGVHGIVISSVVPPLDSVLRQVCERYFNTKPLFIEPGSPWENGYCESFNGKLSDECLNGEIFYSLREAQVIIGMWREHYNTVRPHSSLGYRPPAPLARAAAA